MKSNCLYYHNVYVYEYNGLLPRETQLWAELQTIRQNRKMVHTPKALQQGKRQKWGIENKWCFPYTGKQDDREQQDRQQMKSSALVRKREPRDFHYGMGRGMQGGCLQDGPLKSGRSWGCRSELPAWGQMELASGSPQLPELSSCW